MTKLKKNVGTVKVMPVTKVKTPKDIKELTCAQTKAELDRQVEYLMKYSPEFLRGLDSASFNVTSLCEQHISYLANQVPPISEQVLNELYVMQEWLAANAPPASIALLRKGASLQPETEGD